MLVAQNSGIYMCLVLVLTTRYRPWTGSIKPSLQHFQLFWAFLRGSIFKSESFLRYVPGLYWKITWPPLIHTSKLKIVPLVVRVLWNALILQYFAKQLFYFESVRSVVNKKQFYCLKFILISLIFRFWQVSHTILGPCMARNVYVTRICHTCDIFGRIRHTLQPNMEHKMCHIRLDLVAHHNVFVTYEKNGHKNENSNVYVTCVFLTT